jgi:hypothetical protein
MLGFGNSTRKKFSRERRAAKCKSEIGFHFGLRWRRGRFNLAADLLNFISEL